MTEEQENARVRRPPTKVALQELYMDIDWLGFEYRETDYGESVPGQVAESVLRDVKKIVRQKMAEYA